VQDVRRVPLDRQIATTDNIRSPRTTAILQNGSFENGLTGWTVINGNGVTGNITSATSDFINLGVDSIGGCVTQDTTDYTQFNGGGSRPNNDNTSINATYTGSVSIATNANGLAPAEGSNVVFMQLGGGTRTGPFHVLHGPAIFSDLFDATAGQVVNLQWYSTAGGDDFAVLGYLVDTTTCTQTEVVDETGYSVNGWQFVSMSIPTTSSGYRFVFVNGTHDASGGEYSGASFWVDNISVGNPQTVTFDLTGTTANYYAGAITAPFTLPGTATSGLPLSYTSSTPSKCTVSGTTVTIVGAGVCTITASQSGGLDANGDVWATALPVTSSFTITSYRPQTITFVAPATKNMTDADFLPGGTASSGLAITYTSDTPLTCTIVAGKIHLVAPGTCTVTANQAGNGTYIAAPSVTQSFSIKETQTITFPTIADQSEGSAPISLAATASSGLAITYTSTTPSICTVSGSTVTLVTAGNCGIKASQAGDSTYSAAADVTNTFVVKELQTITYAAPADRAKTEPDFDPAATISSGLAVTYTSTTPLVCTIVANRIHLVGPGTCTTTASQPGDATRAPAADVTQSFIVKDTQTITFPTIADVAADAAPFSLAATASSGLVMTYTSMTPSVCMISNGTVIVLGPGDCSIKASQSGNANFVAAPDVITTFKVKAAQTITFAPLVDLPYTDLDFDPAAIASSTLPVTYTTSTPLVCTIVANKVHMVAPGTCTVTANQIGGVSGGLTYDAAPPVSQSFIAKTVPQGIIFPAIPNKNSYDPSFLLNATTSSGLAVTYTSLTPGLCTVSGSRVTIKKGGGFCKIVARQGGGTVGGNVFGPADEVIREFVISDATRTPTASVTRTATPTPALADLKKAAIGNAYVLALLQDNTLISWGRNERGIYQSTIPSMLRDKVFRDVAASIGTAFALDMDGNVYAWGENLYTEGDIPGDAQTGVKAISAGARFAFAIRSDDTVAAWGRNDFGQTNVPAGLSDVIEVDGGDRHAVALVRDGSVVAWGDNTKGQTNVPKGLTDVIRVSAGQDHTLALLNTGKVIGWGSNAKGQLKIPREAVDVVAIAAGRECSLALKADGTLVTWGDSTYLKFPPTKGVAVVAVDSANQNSIIGLRGGGLFVAGIRNVHNIYTSPTHTATPIITLTASLTPTPSETMTATVSKTPSMTRSATFTPSYTSTRSMTRTRTPSRTKTATRTSTPSRTKTMTRTKSATRTP
jgi:hypothetical protein